MPQPDLRVSDLRQFVYCPRVIYFNYVVPVERKVTYKMREGAEEHEQTLRLEGRRTLGRYRIAHGARISALNLYSARLGLGGRLDMAIDTPHAAYVVEFKSTAPGVYAHHKYQLIGYALLLEERLRKPVRAGFILYLPTKRVHSYEVTGNARLHTLRLLGAVRTVIAKGVMPAPTRTLGRCRDCEFRRYCGDV